MFWGLQENERYQGNISCKDGLDKGQKLYGLTEAEDIKKRWQEYTEELYKKDLHALWGDGFVNQSDCGNHFAIYTCIKSSCYIP